MASETRHLDIYFCFHYDKEHPNSYCCTIGAFSNGLAVSEPSSITGVFREIVFLQQFFKEHCFAITIRQILNMMLKPEFRQFNRRIMLRSEDEKLYTDIVDLSQMEIPCNDSPNLESRKCRYMATVLAQPSWIASVNYQTYDPSQDQQFFELKERCLQDYEALF